MTGNAEPKRKGRPPKKTKERIEKILELSKTEKTQAQIAELVGIVPETISAWKKADLDFSIALTKNMQVANGIVEASLFKRATGYDYTEEFVTRNGVVELRKHAPPDSTSIVFWLKNRKPQDWRDRQEIEHQVKPLEEFETPNGITKV